MPQMTLEQVRNWHMECAVVYERSRESALADQHRNLAAAIAAHLTQPAQAVDVPKGWSAENLKRCCRELNKLIELAGDYDFDEMTVATFETSIACILVCLAALPNANGKEG